MSPRGALATVLSSAVTCRPARHLELSAHARAAVLVPVLDGASGPALLLTVRAPHLSRHAGQIAFPGGRFEPGEDAVAAALRETYEEVGLVVDPDAVLGALDDHPSPFGLIATPVVACVAWPAVLNVQTDEVTEAFVVPLAQLQAQTPSVEVRESPWGTRRLYAYEVDGRRVWGLTGAIIKDLLDRLDTVQVAA